MLCWTCHDKGYVRVVAASLGLNEVAVDLCPECVRRSELAWQAARLGGASSRNDGVTNGLGAAESAPDSERRTA